MDLGKKNLSTNNVFNCAAFLKQRVNPQSKLVVDTKQPMTLIPNDKNLM